MLHGGSTSTLQAVVGVGKVFHRRKPDEKLCVAVLRRLESVLTLFGLFGRAVACASTKLVQRPWDH